MDEVEENLKTTFVGHLESQGIISQLESIFKYFLTRSYKSADEDIMTSTTFFIVIFVKSKTKIINHEMLETQTGWTND